MATTSPRKRARPGAVPANRPLEAVPDTVLCLASSIWDDSVTVSGRVRYFEFSDLIITWANTAEAQIMDASSADDVAMPFGAQLREEVEKELGAGPGAFVAVGEEVNGRLVGALEALEELAKRDDHPIEAFFSLGTREPDDLRVLRDVLGLERRFWTAFLVFLFSDDLPTPMSSAGFSKPGISRPVHFDLKLSVGCVL